MATDSITLTRDELYVFLALLGVRSLSGLPQNMAGGLPDEEAEIRFHCGELTLQERGLLTYTAAGQPVPHDFLIALAGTAALPQATLLLQETQPDGQSRQHFFSRRAGLLVEHSSPRAGLFAFRWLPDAEVLRQRIQAITAPLAALGADLPAAGCDCSVSSACIANFLDKSAAGDPDGAVAALLAGGCAPPAAGDLAAGAARRARWLAVGGWEVNGTGPTDGETALLIAGSAGVWLLHGPPQAPGQVHIQGLDGAAGQEWLLAFAQRLAAAGSSAQASAQEHDRHDMQQEGEDAQLAAELE